MQGKTNILKQVLLNDMPKKDASNERIIPDLLNMKYEYLFRTIGRDGKYSLESKCFFLVLILFISCLITNSLSGTLLVYFIEGWGHFVATVFTGVFVWFLIRFLRKIDEKIHHVNQISSPPKRERGQEGYEEWKRWERKIEKYTKWVRGLDSHKGYYFQAIGGSVCGFILGMFLIGPQHGWVQGNLLTELYLRAWFIFYGFFVGACLHYIFGGFWAIRKYCKDVVSHEEILPLDPDHTGGLRELGRLSLDLDLIVAVPSVAFPIYLLRFRLFEFLGREVKNIETHSEIRIAIMLSALYALLLVLVFFGSISPAHDDMVKAKNNYLLRMHSEYKGMHKELLHKLDTKQRVEPKEYSRLSGLYDLYDRVESMAVWPLDFRTTLRFLITSLLPLISVGITISL